MDKARARAWLRTQVETAVQLSNNPPKIAVWGVLLQLPGDIMETLHGVGAIYSYAGHHWYDYDMDGKIVCVPISKTD